MLLRCWAWLRDSLRPGLPATRGLCTVKGMRCMRTWHLTSVGHGRAIVSKHPCTLPSYLTLPMWPPPAQAMEARQKEREVSFRNTPS